jgi:hypothetical protein
MINPIVIVCLLTPALLSLSQPALVHTRSITRGQQSPRAADLRFANESPVLGSSHLFSPGSAGKKRIAASAGPKESRGAQSGGRRAIRS